MALAAESTGHSRTAAKIEQENIIISCLLVIFTVTAYPENIPMEKVTVVLP